jgi:hypothetical protein
MITVVMLFFTACATTAPRHMMFRDDPAVNISSVKADSGKAALVVVRTTKYGGAIEFDTYLGKKMIGVTQWKSYFVKTDITPGVYYVISKAENMEPVKINFEPDRVYYVHQSPRMGVWKARVSVALETPEQIMKEFDSDTRLVVYDPVDAGEDLSDEDYTQAVSDYEREVKEGLHKEYEGYRGVPAK